MYDKLPKSSVSRRDFVNGKTHRHAVYDAAQ